MHYSSAIVYEQTSCLGLKHSKSIRMETDFRTSLEAEDTLKYLRGKAGQNLHRGLPHKSRVDKLQIVKTGSLSSYFKM